MRRVCTCQLMLEAMLNAESHAAEARAEQTSSIIHFAPDGTHTFLAKGFSCGRTMDLGRRPSSVS